MKPFSALLLTLWLAACSGNGAGSKNDATEKAAKATPTCDILSDQEFLGLAQAVTHAVD